MSRDLHLTSPFLSGDDVLAVERRLLALGFRPGDCDGVFGPATAGAVAAFQRAQGLKADGWVGQVTRGALESDSAQPAARRVKRKVQTDGTVTEEGSAGERALAEALRQLGAVEQPAGSKRQQFGEWFGVDGVPWSAIFVSYCFGVGARLTLGKEYRGAGAYLNGFTYVPAVEAWLHAAGYWIGRAEPQPGDIAVYAGSGERPEHIGIVETVGADGTFTAIEGDTTAEGTAAGGVQRRQHTLAEVSGFGRIEE
jgi:hypothetical protein